MTRAIIALSGSAASLLPRPLFRLSHAVETLWLRLTAPWFHGYHPERHYMRGPGPAWRAKHGQSPSA